MARVRPLRAILAILVLATLIIAARTQGQPAAEPRSLVKVGEVSEGKGEDAEAIEKERLKALVLANTDRGREAIEDRVNTWYRAFKRQLTVARMEEFEKLKTPKRSLYAPRMSTRPGAIGYTDSGRAADLISVIAKVAVPVELFLTYQPCPFSSGLGWNWGIGNQFGNVGGQMFGMGGNQIGMMGAGPPPTPMLEGGNADIQTANTIEFFPPALAIIVRQPSRIRTSFAGEILGGKQTRLESAVWALLAQVPQRDLDNPPNGNRNQKIAKLNLTKQPTEREQAKIWNEVFAQGGVDSGMVIATADFLFEAGKSEVVAEFLKANLRANVVVRPWVYEALAVALEVSGGDLQEIRETRLKGATLHDSSSEREELTPDPSALWRLRGLHGLLTATEPGGWAGTPGAQKRHQD